jgi:hypothetical protein
MCILWRIIVHLFFGCRLRGLAAFHVHLDLLPFARVCSFTSSFGLLFAWVSCSSFKGVVIVLQLLFAQVTHRHHRRLRSYLQGFHVIHLTLAAIRKGFMVFILAFCCNFAKCSHSASSLLPPFATVIVLFIFALAVICKDHRVSCSSSLFWLPFARFLRSASSLLLLFAKGFMIFIPVLAAICKGFMRSSVFWFLFARVSGSCWLPFARVSCFASGASGGG